MPAGIAIDREAVAKFCRRRFIAELALFGFVLRDGFSAQSDVDVLVTFAAGHTPGFVQFHHLEQERSASLGGRQLDLVDLVTRKFHRHGIRDAVLADAEVIHAEG